MLAFKTMEQLCALNNNWGQFYVFSLHKQDTCIYLCYYMHIDNTLVHDIIDHHPLLDQLLWIACPLPLGLCYFQDSQIMNEQLSFSPFWVHMLVCEENFAGKKSIICHIISSPSSPCGELLEHQHYQVTPCLGRTRGAVWGTTKHLNKCGPIFMTVPLNLYVYNIYIICIYGSYPYLKYCTYFQHYTYFTYPRRGTILNTREFCVPMYLPMVLKNIPVKSVFSVSFYLGSGDSGNHCTAWNITPIIIAPKAQANLPVLGLAFDGWRMMLHMKVMSLQWLPKWIKLGIRYWYHMELCCQCHKSNCWFFKTQTYPNSGSTSFQSLQI